MLVEAIHTYATAVVILVPPALPITSLTSPLQSTTIVGHIEERGRFLGAIKLAGDEVTP